MAEYGHLHIQTLLTSPTSLLLAQFTSLLLLPVLSS